MDRTHCAECRIDLPRGGGKLAIWSVGLSGCRVSALLCDKCHPLYTTRGTGGIPHAASQARNGVNAARNKRDDAPLVASGRYLR